MPITRGPLRFAINDSNGERTYRSYQIQNINAYIRRLKNWLRHFDGVATHSLPSCVGWRCMIEREGELTPASIVMQHMPDINLKPEQSGLETQ